MHEVAVLIVILILFLIPRYWFRSEIKIRSKITITNRTGCALCLGCDLLISAYQRSLAVRK